MKIILQPLPHHVKGNSYFLTQHESRDHQVTNSLRANAKSRGKILALLLTL